VNVLVAGFGNIFLSDDGFGCEAVRQLQATDLGPHVTVRDFGTGGLHLALEMVAGYDLVVIVDALARDAPPGTIFAIDCTEEAIVAQQADAHAMTVGAVLGLYNQMREQSGARAARVIVAGCVPQALDEGMELSEPVRAALPSCVNLVRTLARQPVGTGTKR